MPRGRIGYVPKHKRYTTDRTPLNFGQHKAGIADQRADELAKLVIDGIDGTAGRNGLAGFTGGNGANGATAELSLEQKRLLAEDGLRIAVVSGPFIEPDQQGTAFVFDDVAGRQFEVPVRNYSDLRLLPNETVVWAAVAGKPSVRDYTDGATPLPVLGKLDAVATARELGTVDPTYGLFYDADGRYGAGADTILGIHHEAVLYDNGRPTGETKYYLAAVRAPDGVYPVAHDIAFLGQSINVNDNLGIPQYRLGDIASLFELDGYLWLGSEGTLRRATSAAGPWQLLTSAIGDGIGVSAPVLSNAKLWFVHAKRLEDDTFVLAFTSIDPLTGAQVEVVPAQNSYAVPAVGRVGLHLEARADAIVATSTNQTFSPLALNTSFLTAGPPLAVPAPAPPEGSWVLFDQRLPEPLAPVAPVFSWTGLELRVMNSDPYGNGVAVLATRDSFGQVQPAWLPKKLSGGGSDTTNLLVNVARVVSVSAFQGGLVMVGCVELGVNPISNGLDPNRYFAVFVNLGF